MKKKKLQVYVSDLKNPKAFELLSELEEEGTVDGEVIRGYVQNKIIDWIKVASILSKEYGTTDADEFLLKYQSRSAGIISPVTEEVSVKKEKPAAKKVVRREEAATIEEENDVMDGFMDNKNWGL